MNTFPDSVKERTVSFLSSLRKDGLVPGTAFSDSFRQLFLSVSDKEEKTHLLVAKILSNIISSKLMSFTDLSSLADNGQCHPLFLMVLECLVKILDKGVVKDMLNSSKVSTIFFCLVCLLFILTFKPINHNFTNNICCLLIQLTLILIILDKLNVYVT